MSAGDRERPREARRILVLLAVAAATWLPIALLYHLVDTESDGVITQAEFAANSGEAFPGDDAVWVPVELPDDWRVRRPGTAEGWYRIRVAEAVPDDAAVYLPLAIMNAAVLWDGRLVGSGGRFEEPVARNWNRPLLFRLPVQSGSARGGTMTIRVKSDRPDNGLLPRLQVGSHARLLPIHDRATFVRRALLLALMIARLLVAAVTISIWTMWRKEAYFGWFALCAVAWVIAELNLLVVDIPTSTPVWSWIQFAAIGWWGVFAVRLVLDFVGMHKPRLERTLLLACGAGTVALGVPALLDSPWLYPLAAHVWLPAAFLGACTLFRGVLQQLHRRPDQVEFNVVFVVTASVLGCVMFDLLIQLGLLPRGGLNVPSLSSPLAITGMGWVMLRRFLHALREAQSLTSGLERRVHDRQLELEQRYDELRRAERERTLSAERERVFRDMHEGIGSRLVSALALVEQPGVEGQQTLDTTIHAALDDLRLLIDSLDPAEGELLPALATLRSRVEPRLSAAGIRIDWRVEDLPPIPDLGPEKLLQVLRIVQSTFDRTLARPGARTIRLRTGVLGAGSDRSVFVEISDSAPASDRKEHGEVDAMQTRARAMGVAIDPFRTATGAGLRLSICCAPSPAGTPRGFGASQLEADIPSRGIPR